MDSLFREEVTSHQSLYTSGEPTKELYQGQKSRDGLDQRCQSLSQNRGHNHLF